MSSRAEAKRASLTGAELSALRTAVQDGFVIADIYRAGQLSVDGFSDYIRFERLCQRGMLECTDALFGGRMMDPKKGPPQPQANVWCTYVLTQAGEAELARLGPMFGMQAA